jgi:hypothetical protein
VRSQARGEPSVAAVALAANARTWMAVEEWGRRPAAVWSAHGCVGGGIEGLALKMRAFELSSLV